jgi:hypothetical protein
MWFAIVIVWLMIGIGKLRSPNDDAGNWIAMIGDSRNIPAPYNNTALIVIILCWILWPFNTRIIARNCFLFLIGEENIPWH